MIETFAITADCINAFSEFLPPLRRERALSREFFTVGAAEDGVATGCALVRLGTEARLMNVCVDPARRRSGIGRAMAAFAADALRDSYSTLLAATTEVSAPPVDDGESDSPDAELSDAAKFLTACGFEDAEAIGEHLVFSARELASSDFFVRAAAIKSVSGVTVAPLSALPPAAIEQLGKLLIDTYRCTAAPLTQANFIFRLSFVCYAEGAFKGAILSMPDTDGFNVGTFVLAPGANACALPLLTHFAAAAKELPPDVNVSVTLLDEPMKKLIDTVAAGVPRDTSFVVDRYLYL